MNPRKEELHGAGWKITHGLGGDASYMPAWLKRCIFKVIVLDMFVVFLQWLGNASSEGKSVCAGVTATNFWLNFLRANDYFFPANWGLYDFFSWNIRTLLSAFPLNSRTVQGTFDFTSYFQLCWPSSSLLNVIFYKHMTNKSQCSNTVTMLENHEWQGKKKEIKIIQVCPEIGSYIQGEMWPSCIISVSFCSWNRRGYCTPFVLGILTVATS